MDETKEHLHDSQDLDPDAGELPYVAKGCTFPLSLSSLPILAQIMSMADRQALWRATAPAAKQVVDQCFGEYYIMYSTQLYNTEQDFA